MVFSSQIFLFVFLPIVLLIYYNPVFKGRTFRNVFLLFASLLFYAWGEPVFVFLLLFSIAVTWILGMRIEKSRSPKLLLTIGTVYHIFILFIFKYLTFTMREIGVLVNKDFSFVNISLPIGISFFTFQLMSYLFDVYYKKATPQKNPLYVGLYVALFPQLIAGPIVRYETVAYEIENRKENSEEFFRGFCRFVYGLAKKVLIANYMAQIADSVFDFVGEKSVLTAWLGAIAYMLQIYFDFSGYSDMAIGLGGIFGFHFEENFNYPYMAGSITDFWRRWHISLSTWFRDYVYIPMGGNRVKKRRWLLNLLTVWLLTGIWHGANWTFVVWGLVYFLCLLLEKESGLSKKNNVFTHTYTLLIVLLCWVLFRSESLGAAVSYIGSMFGIHASGFYDDVFEMYIGGVWSVLLLAILGTTPAIGKLLTKIKNSRLGWLEGIWVFLLFLLSVLQIVSSAYNPFIYFNF